MHKKFKRKKNHIWNRKKEKDERGLGMELQTETEGDEGGREKRYISIKGEIRCLFIQTVSDVETIENE